MNNSKSIELSNLQLYVKNLDLQKAFYTDLVGLNVISEDNKSAKLGSEDQIIIELIQEDSFTLPATREAGLYHSALVYETRAQLAATINKILNERSDLYQGSSDHGATEAFYFADEEGNGVELYFDKPLNEVNFDASGKPIMDSIYIDERAYIQKNTSTYNSTPVIRIGHLHLKIGNIDKAKAFYVDLLHFDIMSQSNQTLFISKDNYHHHLGMNTWQSLNSGKRLPLKYGMKSFKIEYKDSALFNRIIQTLRDNNYSFEEISEGSISINDPWNNNILLELR